ncbi:MAG: DUF4405 domain-containing protein [Candidatus Omnitrophica bacterium]|nr:DUF4405 domain-containing protein [Candidatus Omnitrophota bacterium]
MKKVQFNFILNLIAFYLLILLIATGLLMEFVLLPGSRGGHGLSMLGWTRHDWGDLHFYFSVGFISVMLLHVILHWAWIRAVFSRFLSAKSAVVMGCILVSSLLFIASPFLIPVQQGIVEEENFAGLGRRGGGRAEQPINRRAGEIPQFKGYMTLADIEAASGVPVQIILQTLDLPADAPVGERIGPLLRSHNLEMEALRAAVYNLMNVEPPAEH